MNQPAEPRAKAGAEPVSRAEFERLQALVNELLARLELPSDAVTPEEIAMLAAVVTAFLGKPVRVHSARRMPSSGPNPWGYQGRVAIQASHRLGGWKGHGPG